MLPCCFDKRIGIDSFPFFSSSIRECFMLGLVNAESHFR